MNPNPVSFWRLALLKAACGLLVCTTAWAVPVPEPVGAYVRSQSGSLDQSGVVNTSASGTTPAGQPYRAAASRATQTLKAAAQDQAGDSTDASASFTTASILVPGAPGSTAAVMVDLTLNGLLQAYHGQVKFNLDYAIWLDSADAESPFWWFSMGGEVRQLADGADARLQRGVSSIMHDETGATINDPWAGDFFSEETGLPADRLGTIQLNTGPLSFQVQMATGSRYFAYARLEVLAGGEQALADFSHSFDASWRSLNPGVVLVGDTGEGVFDPFGTTQTVAEPATGLLLALAVALVPLARRSRAHR